MTKSADVESRPDVGSSRKSTEGLAMSSTPILTRFFSPKEQGLGQVHVTRDSFHFLIATSTHLQRRPSCSHHQPCCAGHGRAPDQQGSCQPTLRFLGARSPWAVEIFQRRSGSLERSILQKRYHPGAQSRHYPRDPLLYFSAHLS